MSEENKKTIEVYKKTAHLYLANSKKHDELDLEKARKKQEKLHGFIKKNLDTIPNGSKVFEIGSGDGSNSKYIKSLGYDVTASDVADDFINASKSHGLKTIKFDVLENEFPEKYSAIFAWRVFVHFTKSDALAIINKVYNALEENGVFIFNVMNRENKNVENEWVDFEGEYHMGVERYYNYFYKNDLDEMINQTKFKIESFHTEGGECKNKWLVYVLKK